MKKILIVNSNLKIGGIQKSLLELLKALASQNKYEVYLFCCDLSGEYLDKVPTQIRILPENPYAKISEQSLMQCKKIGFKFYLYRLFLSAWTRLFGKKFAAKVLCKKISKLAGEYHVAISYMQPAFDKDFCHLTNEIVLNCCKAPLKITFLHCDFGSYGGNTKTNRTLYKEFSWIAAVSNSVGERFCQIMPEVADRVHTVYNICDRQEVLRLSDVKTIQYKKKAIVSIARLSPEKGLLRCLPIYARIKDEGIDFEWHIVGGGALYSDIIQAIKENNLTNNIFVHGEQANPYRFLKNADFMFLPSYHEAAPMVFDEAKCLNVPILTTKTLSAVEMVSEKNAGYICENNEESIYKMLYKALTQQLYSFKPIKPDTQLSIIQFDRICEASQE